MYKQSADGRNKFYIYSRSSLGMLMSSASLRVPRVMVSEGHERQTEINAYSFVV